MGAGGSEGGMIYGSICSGVEAATVAWHPLGWRPAFFSEIEKFPRAVLSHHYPHVPLHGDFTTIEAGQYDPIDLLVGGTPCQDFSVAGLRAGMAGDRGNLTLQFLTLAQRLRPKWLVWENVPGVLSSNEGRDFGAFLGGLGELGYGWAYRTLDAQHFGVPQRRRRVFVVGYLGDWRRAAAVLFERHGLSGNPPPRREAGEGVAGTIAASTGGCDENDAADGRLIAKCLTSHPSRSDGETETFIAHTLRGGGFDASEDGSGRGTPLVPVAFHENQRGEISISETAGSLKVGGGKPGQGYPAVAFNMHKSGNDGSSLGISEDRVDCLRAFEKSPFAVLPASHMAVRRLTPRECERLQGFPDDYTLVSYRGKPAADGPRYKALGNSMAVPVMRWIGERIQMVEAITEIARAAE